MLICIEAIDQEGEFREFSLRIDKIEVGFDSLSSIVSKGNTLLKVFLLDHNNKITNLPPEAFNGLPFSNVIEQLESEWTAILDEYSGNPIDNQKLSMQIKNLADIYEERISNLELIIARMNQLIQRAEIHNAPNNALNSHYKRILIQYSAQLIENNIIHYRLTKLL